MLTKDFATFLSKWMKIKSKQTDHAYKNIFGRSKWNFWVYKGQIRQKVNKTNSSPLQSNEQWYEYFQNISW